MPIKIEVFTMGTQGRKDKVGYLLLSLLGAQPCPTNKIIEVSLKGHFLSRFSVGDTFLPSLKKD